MFFLFRMKHWTENINPLKAFILAHTQILCTYSVCRRRKERRSENKNFLEIKAWMESCLCIIYWNVQWDSYNSDSLFDICKINKSYVNCEQFMSCYKLHSVEYHSVERILEWMSNQKQVTNVSVRLAFHWYPIIIFQTHTTSKKVKWGYYCFFYYELRYDDDDGNNDTNSDALKRYQKDAWCSENSEHVV